MTLDLNQRLNLHAVLGNLECASIRDLRTAWQLMDRLMLSDAEKAEIGFRVQDEGYVFNPNKNLPNEEFEVSAAEMKQIQRALEPFLDGRWKMPARARVWMEPLLAQLPTEWIDEIVAKVELAESTNKIELRETTNGFTAR